MIIFLKKQRAFYVKLVRLRFKFVIIQCSIAITYVASYSFASNGFVLAKLNVFTDNLKQSVVSSNTWPESSNQWF